MRGSSKRLPIIAGIGCLAVIASAGTFWKDIAARYYLHRLQGEPGYLEEILDRPEGTPARAAVRQYVETSEGKNALIRIVLGWHPAWFEAMQKEETVRADIMVASQGKRSLLLVGGSPGKLHRREGLRPSMVQAIRHYLLRPEGEHRTLPEYPGLSFQFRALQQGNCFGCAIRRYSPSATRPLSPEEE